MARLTLPVGQTDFRDIRTSGRYYIDKTMYISQIVRDGAVALQFTRPRRFGKTTFQSMIKAFFDIREDNRDIFTGLAIMDDEEAVEGGMDEQVACHPPHIQGHRRAELQFCNQQDADTDS